MDSIVALKSCPEYDVDKLGEVLEDCLSLLGGVNKFFKIGESVLVKPNLLMDSAPEKGITTHPDFVRAVVRVLKKYNLEVAIGDIPGEHNLESNVERVYKATGMQKVAGEEGIRLLTESRFIEEDGVIFSTWVREFDHIVSLPKFKTHALMTLTGAVKNVFGLTPRLYRVSLHKKFIEPDGFAKMLLGVYKKCRPTLSFVDGIMAMEGNGPASGGTLKNCGLVAASGDALAIDGILATIMGIGPREVATNRQGMLQGIGKACLEDIEIKGDGLEEFLQGSFDLPPSYLPLRLPDPVKKLLKRFAEFRPRVDRSKCNGCRVCIENCPLSAIDISKEKADIDYRKCVDCFCCLEVCPIGAMKTKSGPLIYILKLGQYLKRQVSTMGFKRSRI